MKYIDVSSCQGKIDWQAVATDKEIDGVILRATTKNNKLDTRTIENYNGILHNMSDVDELSVYKFSYAWDYVTARIECRKCLQELNEHGLHFDFFYLDLEGHDGRDYTPNEASAVILAYKDELTAAGFGEKLRLYCNMNYLKNIIEKMWKSIPVWCARYNDYLGEFEPFNVILWQYTSKGKIAGISTAVDISKGVNV